MKLWFNTLIISITYIALSNGYCSVYDAERIYYRTNSKSKFVRIARELINDGLYFTAVPFIKEYLTNVSQIDDKDVDDIVEDVVSEVGVKQFEVLPIEILRKSSASIIRYVLAKKYFRKGKFSRALKNLSRISSGQKIWPFALHLKASIYSLGGKYGRAQNLFKKCAKASKIELRSETNSNKVKQLIMNRDNCIVGISRSQFAGGDYKEAYLSYLDLSKKSIIWPEILFEEAWNSFYLRDFNRTLGKLVTYKAPLLNYIFNPEIEILRALTYLELCLWADTKKVVDSFYKKYQRQAVGLNRYLKKFRKKYKSYYLMAKLRNRRKIKGSKLLNQLLKDIIKDPAYLELYNAFQGGKKELSLIRNVKSRRFKRVLAKSLKASLILQRDLTGAYVRKKLRKFQRKIQKSFEGMSYIKLEVIGRKKRELYGTQGDYDRGRGNIKNLERNDKQYFWTFNGEFWADELGDYVFSLKPECK